MPTMVTTAPAETRSRYWWVPYVYLLRVQLLTAALLLFGPPLASSSPLLRGLFDLDYGPWWRTAFGIALVTLAAFSTAWTLMATTWATVFYAPARFDTARVARVQYPITWPNRELFGLVALPTVLTAVIYTRHASGVQLGVLAIGVAAGLAGAIGAVLLARSMGDRLRRAIHGGGSPGPVTAFLRWMVRQLDRRNVADGYLDPQTRELGQGHVLAAGVFALSAALYAAIGLGKWIRIGYETNVPTLACALLLVLMLCWLLAGFNFFLDRYRVSAVLFVLLVAVGIGLLPLPGSDHTYRTWPFDYDPSPRPDQVLAIGSRTPIVVAAEGGGIQAAAWTARVLTGIDEALPPDLRDAYTHSIRLLSTVSGGGVGAMYFSERYTDAGFNRRQLDDVVTRAETSSLDDVAFGLAYPDAWATFFPPVRLLFGDRGQALESAWTRSLEVARPISAWRTEVWSDLRPANIFNATVVDNGERLLIGTSHMGWQDFEHRTGIENFEERYPNRDIQVVTAARLAAGFPLVSPAARASGPGAAAHVVDGGYYDNYGAATLVEWLNEALTGAGGAASFRRVLVLQIRSDPGDQPDRIDGWHGPLYQLWAPAETLLNVRATGQLSHNNEELALLQNLWKAQGVEIENVVFRFCGEHPPLSWHLARREKQAIADEWQAGVRDGREIRAIERFLRGEPIVGASAEHPFDVAIRRCATDG